LRSRSADVEADDLVELAQAQRARVQGAAVGLLEVVAAVHHAVIMNAVVDGEHVADLVGHQLEAAAQDRGRRLGGAGSPWKAGS
jgi:L-fucose mutarotase/ribose pyranase (RbsD/FucU family)